MKRTCYFECLAGASGDMLLGALLGAGVDQDWFIGELKKLKDIADSFEIKISNVVKKGIAATDVEVELIHHEHHHRGLNDIVKIINSSEIDEKAKDLAIKIFTNLGKAETKVHGTDINKIHFHEVGAIDSIVDIVGFSILFSRLNIDKVVVGPVNTGSGYVKCAHGVMPVPAPATLEIITSKEWPVDNSIRVETELLTPTGAAILTTIKTEFGSFPSFSKINTISYGAGKKEVPQLANVVRFTLGESDEQQNSDETWVIETNIDDMQPEFYDFIFEKLMSLGAFDVFLIPVIMKKNRPANVLTVLCPVGIKEKVEKIIFEETTTFGVRSYRVNRTILNREFKKITLDNLGDIAVKIGRDNSGKILSVKPEYDDCVKVAKENNIPLKDVYNLVLKKVNVDL
ncbi:MAG: TIGR00299 family protein [Candidatus Melainabacteria bacterium RIFOXYA12_FULL_32_12]|nr:MAG: TIGR00299 family protein [Candidatus Melainabacteria bacterium RIFOXYA2_FULL_32_9]OGI27228.1 MAG: TIGR00299 family protein [Candidatus Melainabacteria bacterium RIFOXYA12_FULL_32_12]